MRQEKEKLQASFAAYFSQWNTVKPIYWPRKDRDVCASKLQSIEDQISRIEYVYNHIIGRYITPSLICQQPTMHQIYFSEYRSSISVYFTPSVYWCLFIVPLCSTKSLKWVNLVLYQLIRLKYRLIWRINQRVTEKFSRSWVAELSTRFRSLLSIVG
jgi:hypothetical protein